MDKFRACSSIITGPGDTVLLWSDSWHLDNCSATIQQRFGRLFSFTKDPHITLAEFRAIQDVFSLFHLPLSSQAHIELSRLQRMMAHISVDDLFDQWIRKGGQNGQYSAKKYYDHVHAPIQSNTLL